MVGFCLLALAYYYLFRYDSYGIEEGAARALLINWSIVHQIANPIAFFGVPDLRAILFILLSLHWVGSLAAAKVFTMLILFATALFMHRWSCARDGDEVAMLATGLLLLSPLCLMQSDSVGGGIYLLFGFISIYWLHDKLRRSEVTVPGYYFLMLVLVALVVSIHPVGLAAPIALLVAWQRIPHQQRKQRIVMIGVAISMVVMVLVRWGWSGMEDVTPIPRVLSDIWLGSPLIHGAHDWLGYLIALLLLAALVAVPIWRRLDLMAGTLLLAGVIGLFHPDAVWATMVMTLLYYLGMPALIRLNTTIGGASLIGKRGLVLLLVTVVAVVCMQSMKQMAQIRPSGLKSPSDMLISVLAQDAAMRDRPFQAASQWPGRTMLATRRDVFPLPPVSDDIDRLRRNVKPLTHMVFDYRAPRLQPLTHSMAALNGEWETVAITAAGVALRRRATASHPR